MLKKKFGENLGNLLRAFHSNSAHNSGLKKLLGIFLVEDGLMKDDSTQIPMLNYSGAM